MIYSQKFKYENPNFYNNDHLNLFNTIINIKRNLNERFEHTYILYKSDLPRTQG